MQTTRLSSKGQIILPKAVRDAHHFQPGLEFVVEEHPDGIFLRPLRTAFAPTRLEDILGCAGYRGPALTIDDMDAAIARGALAVSDAGGPDDRD
jgi:AbrB family looped-hinge helix DNA binding protein